MNTDLEKMISDSTAFIAKLEDQLARLDNVLLDKGWVVINAGFGMQFKVGTNGLVTNPQSICGSAINATRFTQRDARMVAANTFNGHGEACTAMSLVAALEWQIADQRELLVTLNDAKARLAA